jgi:hypothetical protein
VLGIPSNGESEEQTNNKQCTSLHCILHSRRSDAETDAYDEIKRQSRSVRYRAIWNSRNIGGIALQNERYTSAPVAQRS